jgi:hypothetical protein
VRQITIQHIDRQAVIITNQLAIANFFVNIEGLILQIVLDTGVVSADGHDDALISTVTINEPPWS